MLVFTMLGFLLFRLGKNFFYDSWWSATPEVRTPIMLYLLEVMGELVNGERLIYVISEFWKALDNEIFHAMQKKIHPRY